MPRRRDRRRGFAELLAVVARSLERRVDSASMRSGFEQALRRVVPVRSVTLRESAPRWPIPEGQPSESVALEVLGSDPSARGVLEATFDPGCRLGEWDFQVLSMAAHVASLILEIERTRSQLLRAGVIGVSRRQDAAAPLIGSTPVMARLRDTIERVAGTDFTVLLEGESGVGKELVARQIHDLSRRRHGPFVAINCAALVETLLEAELFGIEDRTATGVRGRRGKFEAADGGTLFLDEVSDLSLSAQAKLLRTIQDLSIERVGGNGAHRVDIRIIAATNRTLSGLVERQLFRPDLYYRLSGVDVRVPSLRERHDDILELARYFLDRHRTTRPLQLSTAAAEALVSYHWPGNVRELERLIERAVAFSQSEVIELDDLPATVRGDHVAVLGPSIQRGETMRAWGSRYAHLVLERCGANKRKACRVLGITYHTLQAYLKYEAQTQAPADTLAVSDEATETDPLVDVSDEGLDSFETAAPE
ncbi:MAG TPA: sigma 54-interacting transcriptional regulator [Vicinamibacterales bacterium]|nr:sigma 54-interacting transcriptional regulator [Vicinamibacterales bacterium]